MCDSIFMTFKQIIINIWVNNLKFKMLYMQYSHENDPVRTIYVFVVVVCIKFTVAKLKNAKKKVM